MRKKPDSPSDPAYIAPSRRQFSARLALAVLAPTVPGLVAARKPQPSPAPSPAPSLTVAITTPAAGATLRPNDLVRVSAGSLVVRVELSIVSNSYVGWTENVIGASNAAPFDIRWTGRASAIAYGGYGHFRLLARALDANNRTVLQQVGVVVPGSWGGPDLPRARNTAAAGVYQLSNLSGARVVTQSYLDAVRQIVEFAAVDDMAEFVIAAPQAGTYEMSVDQVRLTGSKPPLEVSVNGAAPATIVPTQSLTTENEFDRRGVATIIVPMLAGANVVRLRSTGAGVVSVLSLHIAQP